MCNSNREKLNGLEKVLLTFIVLLRADRTVLEGKTHMIVVGWKQQAESEISILDC